MSTISGLLLSYPNTRPYDAISPTINAINAASGITQGQTALLTLQKAREQQAAQTQLGSLLAQLGTAQGVGAAGEGLAWTRALGGAANNVTSLLAGLNR